jgi:hypothetical protein
MSISVRHRVNLLPAIAVAILTLVHPSLAQQAIVIDHKCTDSAAIPQYWLDQARLLTFHYAHTSHGSQITTGLAVLEGQHAAFSCAIRVSSTEGLPAVENPPALRIYDGNPPETYIEPGDYWDGDSGKNRTRAVANTGHYGFSMWSWCGQQSSNSQSTTQRYIDTLAQFESEYPSMRFIYMTGHTDGSGETGTLHQRNNQVRDYCRANGKVLFDFADIESYDPDGNYYLNLACNDNCDYWVGGVQHNWATEWCAAHPGHELCASCSCAHSQALNCNVKARAFWWMMARLAGWPGPPRADLNEDGFVSGSDLALFVACTTAPQIAYDPESLPIGCTLQADAQNHIRADLDADGDVDLEDFGRFQRCYAGPDTPPDPACAD